MTEPITRDQLRSAIDDGTATVVDALPAAPYGRRHLPGALNLVLDDADAKSPNLLPDKSATIVTYSTDVACGRGEALAERLEELGYTDVRVYHDGIEDWVSAGLPVETGIPPLTTRSGEVERNREGRSVAPIMRRLSALVLLLGLACSTSACYHAQVVTGRPPSDEVVEEEWHLGFVYGLVIPEEINVEEECPDGVARVETKLSFLNRLVSLVTGGIFTPMHVAVTCAAAAPGSAEALDTIEGTDLQSALQEAAERSWEERKPVYVWFAD